MKKICILIFVIAGASQARSQAGVVDFGNSTGIVKCNLPYTGVVKYCSDGGSVSCQSSAVASLISSNWYKSAWYANICQFNLANPGDTAIGTGSELQFLADDFADLRFQVSDFNCSSTFKLSFKIKINRPSSQHYSYPSIMLYFGDRASAYLDKNKTPNFYNSPYPEDTAIFGSINFRSDGSLPGGCNGADVMCAQSTHGVGIYPAMATYAMSQGEVHTVQVFANTGSSDEPYVSPGGSFKVLPSKHYDLYIDTVMVYGVSFPNYYYKGGSISGFSWYMNQPNYFSPIIIDDIEWSSEFFPVLLPVELSRFDVADCSNNLPSACLKWETETELNNEEFVIERSTDAIMFDTVGSVLGYGTSTVHRTYQYEDMVSEGTYYYRLKQIDYDGHFEYSDIRFVRIREKPQECNMKNIFQQKDIAYRLYDMNGREMKVLFDDRAFIEKGMYIVTILDGSEVRCRGKVWIE